MVNLLAFDDLNLAFASLLEQFNGLQELVSRDDAAVALQNVIDTINSDGKMDADEIQPEYLPLVTKYGRAMLILAMINKEINRNDVSYTMLSQNKNKSVPLGFSKQLSSPILIKARDSFSFVLLSNPGSITTPGGASVTVFYNVTWADQAASYNQMFNTSYTATSFYNQCITDHSNVTSVYQNVTVISGISPVYNCHNYAWNTSSPSGAWMNDPSPYWGANVGYSSISMAQVGCKIVYAGVSHSGKITGTPVIGAPQTWVRSKWGPLGVL
jgi:hypothetical protein